MVRGRGFTINTRGAAPVASEGRRRDRWGPNREFDSLHIVYITACGCDRGDAESGFLLRHQAPNDGKRTVTQPGLGVRLCPIDATAFAGIWALQGRRSAVF